MSVAKKALLEFVAISVLGTALSLGANAINSRGVSLERDYFPRGHAQASQPAHEVAAQTVTASAQPVGNGESPRLNGNGDEFAAEIEAIRNEGLQPIVHADVVAAFEDPLHKMAAHVFIDARDDQNYAFGHIPGAYQLDHYLLDDYIEQVLPACQQAVKIIIYCNGGDCEDSRFAAQDLIERGIDPAKIFVYPGGISQWCERNLPVERGARGSGDVLPGSQVGGAQVGGAP